MTKEPLDRCPYDGIRVLCVDSVASVAQLTAGRLEDAHDDITAVTVTSAADALQRLADGGIDCVVSEQQLSGQDGLALLGAVRAENPDLPFVLFTAVQPPDRESVTDDVTDIVPKRSDEPYHQHLADSVRAAVAARPPSDEAERTSGGAAGSTGPGGPGTRDSETDGDRTPDAVGSGTPEAGAFPGYLRRHAAAGAERVAALRNAVAIPRPLFPGVEPVRHLGIAVLVVAVAVTAAMGAGVLGVDSVIGGGASMDAGGPDGADAAPPATETSSPTPAPTTMPATETAEPTPAATATGTAAPTPTPTAEPLTPEPENMPTKTPGPTLEPDTETATATPSPTPTPDDGETDAESAGSDGVTSDDPLPV